MNATLTSTDDLVASFDRMLEMFAPPVPWYRPGGRELMSSAWRPSSMFPGVEDLADLAATLRLPRWLVSSAVGVLMDVRDESIDEASARLAFALRQLEKPIFKAVPADPLMVAAGRRFGMSDYCDRLPADAP